MLAPRRKALNAALSGNMICSCTLLLTTMFLLETPFVGFNAAVTASVYILFTFLALVMLNKTPSAFSLGFLGGASLVIVVLAFQSALYWALEAQSHARRPRTSYLASGLHALIFCVQCFVTTLVIKSREDVIDTYAAYEYIPDTLPLTTRSTSTSSINHYTTVPTADI